MFHNWLYAVRILVVAVAAGLYGISNGSLTVPEWLAALPSMPLGVAVLSLGVVWLGIEALHRNAPPDDLEARLKAAVEGRPAGPPAGAVPAEPQPEELARQVLSHAAAGDHDAVIRAVPGSAVAEPLIARLEVSQQVQVQTAMAVAELETGEEAAAFKRAQLVRRLDPGSATAREILCRAAPALGAGFRVDELYPVYRELKESWKPGHARLVQRALEIGLDRPLLSARLISQIWDLLETYRDRPEVVGPVVEKLEEQVEAKPDRADLLALVARLKAAAGDSKAAMNVASRALSLSVDCPGVYQFLIEQHAAAGRLSSLSLQLGKLRDTHPGHTAVEKAIETVGEELAKLARAGDGARPPAPPLDLGMGHFASGNFPAAISSLQEALRGAGPGETAVARYLLARAFLRANQVSPALEHLDQLDLNSLDLEQRYELGADLESCGELARARRAYASVAAQDRSFRDVEARVGRVDEALSADPQQKFQDDIVRAIPERYREVRLAGKGGMGMVFKALDTESGKPVAIKVLSPMLASELDHRRRFLREARTLESLAHPGVVAIVEVVEKPFPFYVMEFLEGRELGQLLGKRGRLTPAQSVHLVYRAAEALAYCHEKGLVHRDIKPANILLSKDGRVIVIDFGLVHAEAQTVLTRTGALMGTPAYMAPEQVSGGRVVPATDIYALGATLYQLMTGVVPFEGDEVISQVMMRAPRPPRELVPEIPEALDAIVVRCLEKKPEKRFATCRDLCFALAWAMPAR